MDYDKLIEQAQKDAKGSHPIVPNWAAIVDKKQLKEYAAALSTLQAENEKLKSKLSELAHLPLDGPGIGERTRLMAENAELRAELEQVKRENDALWMYIEIVDREYRRYMDRGYIDRLGELRRTWRRGQKED